MAASAASADNGTLPEAAAQANTTNEELATRSVPQQQHADLALTETSAAASSSATTRAHAAAAVAVRADSTDMTWIFTGMVIMIFLYALSGVSTHFETTHDHETIAERVAHRLAGQWPTPLFQDGESFPALSGQMLGPSSDMPLLLPVAALEAKDLMIGQPGWSMDILSQASKPMLTASIEEVVLPIGPLQQVKQDYRHQANLPQPVLKISGRSEHGAEDHAFVSVDSSLIIRDNEGSVFGRIVKEPSGEYALQEARGFLHDFRGRRVKWAFNISEERPMSIASMVVTWRPKGTLLATAVRFQSKKFLRRGPEYLKVMNSQGVDMILVLACLLGVAAFEVGPRRAAAALAASQKSAEEHREEGTAGFATGIINTLQEQGVAAGFNQFQEKGAEGFHRLQDQSAAGLNRLQEQGAGFKDSVVDRFQQQS